VGGASAAPAGSPLARGAMIVERADVRVPEIVAMLERLTAELAARYHDDGAGDFEPRDVECARSVFLVAREGALLAGCAALRPCRDAGTLADETAEVKRMYVEPAFRGRGVGARLLAALEEHARAFGYRRVWLETGAEQPEALRLYEGAGYKRIALYGYYKGDPRSRCFEKVFDPSRPVQTHGAAETRSALRNGRGE